MAKSLVIVESPAKAKTINKYLGDDYIVRSSVGHIRDLPTSARDIDKPKTKPIPRDLAKEEKEKLRRQRSYANLVRNMGIDPENGWEPHYIILPGKHKILKELKQLADASDTVYLATDLGREGEAIAWHLREAIGGDSSRYRRVKFGEITKPAIQKAFQQPGDLDMTRVEAQQTRRFLDRVVGYMVSPLLWKKIARGLSAGRVQSVAVRLIVEREREIHAFVPEEFWDVFVDLKADQRFRAQVSRYRGKKFVPGSKEQVDKAVAELRRQTFTVSDFKMTPVKQRPHPPFITSTLQQAASVRLGFSVKKTMTLAQRLYQAGHITYMRTDSRNISPVALKACREYIDSTYGKRYLPEKANVYASGQSAQEAHEAIRPTQVGKSPQEIQALERDEARLYDLIWRQFVACQMTPAQFDRSTIVVQAGDYECRATGRVMRFDGWMRVLPPKKSEDAELPEVNAGQLLDLEHIEPVQHFTKPPARYTEASLVKELEKRGIGRPSTYASIISTIQQRGYVELIKKRFYAKKIGDIVTQRLVNNFTDLMDYDFTAQMEQQLDEIAKGDADWRRTLDEFYADFTEKLEQADEQMQDNEPVPVDIQCPVCGLPMQLRTARTGSFLSCSGYNKPPKERCKETINLIPGEEVEPVPGDQDAEAKELLSKKRCPECGTAMDSWLIDAKHRLWVCGNSPDCPGTVIEQGQFRIKGYDGPVVECDKCGADMQLKTGRFGKFFACTNPDCKNTRKLMRNGQPAPPKADPVPMPELECEKSDGYFILRDGLAGVFLASNQFPRSRETKSPMVQDLARHRDELDPKFHYLADAPQQDPDGNPVVIKWKRKEKRQVLAGLQDGKATKWQADYEDGKWKWKDTKAKKKK